MPEQVVSYMVKINISGTLQLLDQIFIFLNNPKSRTMWKSLAFTQRVYQGDKIRFNAHPAGNNFENLFEVVKTDEHYFEVLPITSDVETLHNLAKKIVRYFDIGYYLQIEIWEEAQL